MTGPVLLTGASGVVGSALREILSDADVISAHHRTPVAGRTVRLDITAERLGLEQSAHNELAGSISGIVHAAANTRLNADADTLTGDNLHGTRRVVDLANTASVPLVYVSTAFVDAIHRPENAGITMQYAQSKAAAEQFVRDHCHHYIIVRPSIVVGDSRDGHIAEFQGIYQVAAMLALRKLPFIPASAEAYVDIVPQDVVAATIADLICTIRAGRAPRSDQVWVTAGAAAPTVGEVIDEMVGVIRTATGSDLRAPRYIDNEMFERLIRPVFIGELEPSTARRVTNLIENVAPYIAIREPLPDPRTRPDAGQLRTVLRRSLTYWTERQVDPANPITTSRETSHA